MTQRTDDSLSFGIGILAGVLGGIALGILFSPKPGEEMRRELKDTAEKFIKDAPENAVSFKKVNKTTIEKLQYTIENHFNKVIDAVKAARMAAAKKKEEEMDANV